ncbi:UDP-glycosyltransferase 88A1-like [Neltuma alba]|uniref:UDP-glycosyltransferase 88A1-like n=1 Tax=Neltuma alba TaxID=207710 RepID=UPI0010A54A5A|nr:UDP-glycosyltransferase 88A1-like [Prosopis alba]
MQWGHLVPIVELSKLILSLRPSLSITILLPSPPNPSIADYVAAISTSVDPHIVFEQLPPVSPPLPSTPPKEILEILRLNSPNLHQALISISKTHAIIAFIVDFFASEAISVSLQLNIPTYYFFTTSASNLVTFLYLPTIHRTTDKSLKEIDTHLNIPGLPPIAGEDMPEPVLERNDFAYEEFLKCSVLARKTAGIIVNTFEALEDKYLGAIFDGFCILDGPTPPIYPVGPLISRDKGKVAEHECLKWLDSQPQRSVVFLSFGSLGLFSREQLHEIARGLEGSGQRFLWVVRNPPSEKTQSVAVSSQVDPDLVFLLPEGFMDRTRGRGMVVKKWAPQVEVLNHGSVGGFVTHCGWNSVLEALVAGVPMVAWPLYAEQRFNRVMMVVEMKIALWMRESSSSEGGWVEAVEVEERVTELMESEKGQLVRKRVEALNDGAEAASRDGGTSRVALAKLNFIKSHMVAEGNWKKRCDDHGIMQNELQYWVNIFKDTCVDFSSWWKLLSLDDKALVDLVDDSEVDNLFQYNDTSAHVYLALKESTPEVMDDPQIIDNYLGLSQQMCFLSSRENNMDGTVCDENGGDCVREGGGGCHVRLVSTVEIAPTPMPEMNAVKWKELLLGKKQTFANATEFRKAVYKFSIAENFEYKYVKNCEECVHVKCKVEGCP